MKQEKFTTEELQIIKQALDGWAGVMEDRNEGENARTWRLGLIKTLRSISARTEKMLASKNYNKNVARFQSWNRKYEIDELLDARSNAFREYDIFDVTAGKPGNCVGHLTVASEVDPSENEDRRYLIKEAKAEIASLNLE